MKDTAGNEYIRPPCLGCGVTVCICYQNNRPPYYWGKREFVLFNSKLWDITIPKLKYLERFI